MNSSLRPRLLSTLVLVPSIVALVLFAPAGAAAGVLAVPLLIAAYEWARLSGLEKLPSVLATGAFALLLAVSLVVLGIRVGSLLAGGVGLLADGAFAVFLFESGHLRVPTGLGLVLGMISLGVLWWTAAALMERGPSGRAALLSLFVLVWVADSVAYLVGRRLGRRALAPRVSPGKTCEGALGGLGATLLAASLLGLVGALGRAGGAFVGGMGLAVWAAALLGDLAESQAKRRRGVKDSGRLIPGHGGLLDRIDGLMAAAPVFYCLWCLKGVGGW